MEVDEGEAADFLAAMPAEEVNQPMRRRNIGSNCVRAPAAIMGKIVRPARGQCSRRMPLPV